MNFLTLSSENSLPAEELRDRLRRAQTDHARWVEIDENADGVRDRCKSLRGFIEEAWSVLEPTEPYIHGWHIDAVSEHLEAISRGEFNRLLINQPPGTMKSLMTGVFWPAWEWAVLNRPSLRIFGSAYAEDYAKRDNRKMRDLIQSDWFQALWPLELLRVGESEFENVHKGWRKAVPFNRLTGGRGDRVIIDDPLSTEQAESEADRLRAARIFKESLPSRVINPSKSAIVVIMQRLHEQDTSGLILAGDYGYEHLCLPMEFEPDRRCSTRIGFTDPRKKENQLLFPERFPREVVERDKAIMGSYATAGQFQQRPAPREGGIFRREWFKTIAALPADIMRTVRAWDFAATEGAGDWTVGVKMHKTRDGKFIIEAVLRFRGSAHAVEQAVEQTAKLDGKKVAVRYPQDPGQAGKAQAEVLAKKLAGYIFKYKQPTGPKHVRAGPLSASAEAGNVYLLVTGDPTADAWINPFLDEVCMFPAAKHDDQVDAAADAFSELALGRAGYNLAAAMAG